MCLLINSVIALDSVKLTNKIDYVWMPCALCNCKHAALSDDFAGKERVKISIFSAIKCLIESCCWARFFFNSTHKRPFENFSLLMMSGDY